ncbi:hypothetical protein Q9K01_11825 [Qipengyuania sp. DY56-A-20]|uniref:Uncharacterized protein n=1 Tax=Qipengyuania benthica TaxID=3067651 RepID=A0ABT9HAF9_9SPHN|nr:hypothetical protein [Qipengyuania sp. DY56-A-20]MDP4540316.1 hypothetical protein [Qipengyuania sp. DY56-A-20]
MAGKEDPTQNSEHRWEGLQEIDRAISENRLTSYSWKKAWADPWGRIKLIAIFVALAAFVAFVIVNDVIL